MYKIDSIHARRRPLRFYSEAEWVGERAAAPALNVILLQV